MKPCGWDPGECIHDAGWRPAIIVRPHPEMKFGWVMGNVDICTIHKGILRFEDFFDEERKKNLQIFLKENGLPPATDDQITLEWVPLTSDGCYGDGDEDEFYKTWTGN